MPVNRERIRKTFAELVAIDSPSFNERAMADELIARLNALGVETREDDAAAKIKGTAGNLIAALPGEIDLPPLLFSSHMDTVEPSRGKRAIFHPDGRITSGGDTVLGADDAGGLTAILEALTVIREEKIPHRPLEIVFPAAEEPHGQGSKNLHYEELRSREAYVLDLDGPMGRSALRAPSILHFTVHMKGRAAHAGFSPELGVHAVQAMSAAIAKLKLGRPEPGLTANIGVIRGGLATNIVPELCTVEGEVRGLDHQRVLDHMEQIASLFRETAEEFGAQAEILPEVRILAYDQDPESPVVRRWRRACGKLGIEPKEDETFGGSDLNNFQPAGIQGIVLASAMQNVHSTGEWSDLNDLTQLAELTLALMTDTEE